MSRQQYAFFMQQMGCPFADIEDAFAAIALSLKERLIEANVTRPSNAIFVNMIHLWFLN